VAFNVESGGGRGKKPQPKPTINVTPLVDVILVVLIIFMMVTPMMMKTFWLNVPKAAEPAAAEQPAAPVDDDEAKRPLVMTVDREGKIRINRHEVPVAELGERLPRLLAAKENKVLYFDAADEAPYGVAASVMDASRAAGAQSIAILTQRIAD